MKELMIGIGLMSCSFFAHTQIGLQTGTTLFLVENIVAQPIPSIDLVSIKEENRISENLQPTWSFSESNVYDTHFGFFCKVEVKIDKVAKMQTRFRLGSVDYVNGLEGK